MISAGMPPIKKPSMTMMTASEIGPRISGLNLPRPRAYSRTLRSRCQRVGLLFSGFSLARLALPAQLTTTLLKRRDKRRIGILRNLFAPSNLFPPPVKYKSVN
jgi:hypothetical protein